MTHDMVCMCFPCPQDQQPTVQHDRHEHSAGLSISQCQWLSGSRRGSSFPASLHYLQDVYRPEPAEAMSGRQRVCTCKLSEADVGYITALCQPMTSAGRGTRTLLHLL